MDQELHAWPARYRHWRLEIVESDDHYHWLLTIEIRQLLPRFRADKALEHVYGASIRRLDTGPNLYIVDSSSKLSQRTRPILSHLFVEEFGYSDVDKSTVIFVS